MSAENEQGKRYAAYVYPLGEGVKGEWPEHDERQSAENDAACACEGGCDNIHEGGLSRLCESCRYEGCVSVIPPGSDGAA